MDIWSRRSTGTGQLLCCLEWLYTREPTGQAMQLSQQWQVMWWREDAEVMIEPQSTVPAKMHPGSLVYPVKTAENEHRSRSSVTLSHTPHCLFGQSYCMSLVTSTDSRNWSCTESEYLNSVSLYSQLLFEMYFVPCSYHYSANPNSHLFPIVYVCKVSAISFL